LNRASSLAWWLCLVIPALLVLGACGSSQSVATETYADRTVLVVGATGGTGRALVRNLLAQDYKVRAFVRDEDKGRVVLGDDIDFIVGDVREPATVLPAMDGMAYVISAIGASRSDPTNNPEAVDYNGVKNLAEAAAQSGVKQFVLVSSSGVTQEDHFLNKAMDNVLIWKFKGEEALRNSGVPYTIVRPGGLVNTPGGIDTLVFAQGDTTAGRISREDVALICIAALQIPLAADKTFEIYSSEEPGTNDWAGMFGALQAD
jgi:uncharacterized protein YbjT (DUF2867 family)